MAEAGRGQGAQPTLLLAAPPSTVHSDFTCPLLPSFCINSDPTTLAPSLKSRSEGSSKAVTTQSSPGEQPHPCTAHAHPCIPVPSALHCHLQAALHDFPPSPPSHALSQEGGAVSSGAPTVGQAWARHWQMPPGLCVALSPSWMGEVPRSHWEEHGEREAHRPALDSLVQPMCGTE